MICDENSSLFDRKLVTYLLLVSEGGQENTLIGPKNKFQSIRKFSCPPQKNKNKQVTSLRQKSRHLFL